MAAKVSRLIVRIKIETSIDIDKAENFRPVAVKTKKVAELTALTSFADMKAFHQLAVQTPRDFEINLRDVSNKIRLLSLQRLDVLRETKAVVAGPYPYHKQLKKRIVEGFNEGFEAFLAKDFVKCRDLWEVASQQQQLKDWVGVALLRDKPVCRQQSDRLHDVYHLLCAQMRSKTVTHADHVELTLRAQAVKEIFRDDGDRCDCDADLLTPSLSHKQML